MLNSTKKIEIEGKVEERYRGRATLEKVVKGSPFWTDENWIET